MWKTHPNSDEYLYLTTVNNNGYYPLRHKNSSVIYEVVSNDECRLITYDDVDFLQAHNIIIGVDFIPQLLYKYNRIWYKTIENILDRYMFGNNIINITDSKNNKRDVISITIVGMRFHTKYKFTLNERIMLEYDDNNIHDPNAIKIISNNTYVAYVLHEDAVFLRKLSLNNPRFIIYKLFPNSVLAYTVV